MGRRFEDLESRRSGGTWSRKLEFWLVVVLGLSLPLVNTPFFVWRGFGVDLAHISGSLLIAAALAGAVFQCRRRPSRLLCFVAAGILVVPLFPYVVHRLPGFSIDQFWRSFAHLAFMLAIFLVLSSANLSRRHFDSILRILVCEAVLLAAYGVWQAIAYRNGWPTGIGAVNSFSREPMRGGFSGVWRATATFEEPRYLANHLLTAMVSAAWLARRRYVSGRKAASMRWVAALALLSTGILFTLSLGGVAALLILAAGMAFAMYGRLTRRARVLMTAGLATALFGVGVYYGTSGDAVAGLVRERLETEIASPLESLYSPTAPYFSRGFYLHNARYALVIANESPLVGIGVGQFSAVGRIRGRQLGFPSVVLSGGPWVGLTGILAEFGLAGILLFTILGAAISQRDPRSPGPPGTGCRFLSIWLLVAICLEELGPGFYLHFWMWFPLGMAGLGRYVPREGAAQAAAGGQRHLAPDHFLRRPRVPSSAT